MLSGCVTHHHYDHPSVVRPPPRVAKHGHVHHHRGVSLVFDSGWNGYWVRGHTHHYFHANRYFRWHGGRWQRAERLDGPWVVVKVNAIPNGLDRHHARSEPAESAGERRHDRHEVATERREERREAARDHREEEREVARERRDEHREVATERREERREAARDHREDKREVVAERRERKRQTSRSSERSEHKGKPAGGEGNGKDAVPANQSRH